MKRVIGKVKFLYWKLKNLLFKIIGIVFYACSIKDNKIIVFNFAGKGYGDNPKYLVNAFLNDERKFDIVWFVNKKDSNMPKEIKQVKFNTLAMYYHMTTAKLWIDNIRNNPRPLIKRKKQLFMQTWHGSGVSFKTVEKDAEKQLGKAYIKAAKKDGKLADFMISGSEFNTQQIKRAFWFNHEILTFGAPKNDILFSSSMEEVDKLKQDYGISGKKIVLYAPSFRNDRSFYVKYKFDAPRLMESIERKFGDGYVLCLRLHPNDSNITKLPEFQSAVDLTGYPDSQVVLKAADIVISDFSGMFTDSFLMDKVALFYAPDYDNYIASERKLYFDLEKSGVNINRTFDQLVDSINDFTKQSLLQTKQLLTSMGVYKNEHSSEDIKNYLINKMDILD